MRGWRLFAIAILTHAVASDATAQTTVELRGRVLDSITGAPVRDAVVRVPALQRYTLTGDDGVFRLDRVPTGRHGVVIVQLGYEERRAWIDVQPGAFHELRLAPQPIALDALVAADSRHVQRVLDSAARLRIMNMSGPARARAPPIFWQSWDRDRILASGIHEPLRFLSHGPPRVSVRNCAAADGRAPDALCIGVPYAGWDPVGFGNMAGSRNNLDWGNRTGRRTRLMPSLRDAPTSVPAAVFLYDRRLGGLEALVDLSMDDIHRVETYGYRGENGIRLYTEGYLRLVATGVITPDARAQQVEVFDRRPRPPRP
jgi:hypothetical protein